MKAAVIPWQPTSATASAHNCTFCSCATTNHFYATINHGNGECVIKPLYFCHDGCVHGMLKLLNKLLTVEVNEG